MDTPSDADRETDADLIDTAFDALFDRHAVAVHRYLARRIGATVADDLLAQTFLVAFEGRAGYDRARPDARPWLYGIATNLLHRHRRDEVNQYRAWSRTGSDPTARPDSHPGVDLADRIAERADAHAAAPRLASALADLTAPDRDVLLLFAWSGLAYTEIAEALDIPVGTVRSRLNRARTLLRRALPELRGTTS